MMPDTISYPAKRGTIYYTPPGAIKESEPPQLPTPPCRPRARRPHTIIITRLPTPGSHPQTKSTSKRKGVKNFKTIKVAKRVATSIFAHLIVIPSITSPSIASPSLNYSKRTESHDSRYFSSNFATITRGSVDTNSLNRTGEDRRLSETNMMRLSAENPWRPANGNDSWMGRNSVSAITPRNNSIVPQMAPSPRAINETEKPLASGNGVSCSIIMAEPVIFLMGLDNDGTTRDSHGANATALLRGTLRLNVTKSSKIKAIRLKFTGRAKTLWPEGIPPMKQETVEVNSLRTQVLPFFNALHEGSSSGYGDLCTYTLRDKKLSPPSATSSALDCPTSPQQSGFSFSGITSRSLRHVSSTHAAEGRRFSVPSLQTIYTPKGDKAATSLQPKGYKVFPPGVYDYSFELPIDNNMPETTDLPLASVKWELEATVERAGTFKANLTGKKEVPVIRLPSQDSLELVEPIAVSRTWEQQLHYDIVISGKSFPIGTKIPIAFKLTPLAKIQVHKVKVYLSENVDYYAKDRSVQRKDIKRKMLLFEKSAGKPISKEFSNSDVKIVGGERTAEERETRRNLAMRRREIEAERNNSLPTPLPDHVNNLLGDIDLGVEEWWGPTEIEMNVQLPTCEAMEKDRSKRLVHDCTWKNVQVHHWLKILIRLSRADEDDPSKRRHYEISVDSPISLLSCRASLANISLPEYSGLNTDTLRTQQVCGCLSMTSSTKSGHDSENVNLDSLHLSHIERTSQSTNPGMGNRPMHLVRSPSFLPPPFDAEEPPPPIETPPPLYDNVFGDQTHDSLADYFERLVEYEDELTDDDDDGDDMICPTSNGRIHIPNPQTHQLRIARSMELHRDFMFNPTAVNSIVAGIDPGVSDP